MSEEEETGVEGRRFSETWREPVEKRITRPLVAIKRFDLTKMAAIWRPLCIRHLEGGLDSLSKVPETFMQ